MLIGFANRLARRMTTHNGYKTLSEPSTLAQLHPSTARIAADEDGLLPDWVIYHELVSTARVFLSKVSFEVECEILHVSLHELSSLDVCVEISCVMSRLVCKSMIAIVVSCSSLCDQDHISTCCCASQVQHMHLQHDLSCLYCKAVA